MQLPNISCRTIYNRYRYSYYLFAALWLLLSVTFQQAFAQTTPTITSVSPTPAVPGDTVTITGTNLQNASIVQFGTAFTNLFLGSPSFQVISPTQIRAVVPGGVNQSPITPAAVAATVVITPNGQGILPGIVYPAPIINSVSPQSVKLGDTITIIGKNFFDRGRTGLSQTIEVFLRNGQRSLFPIQPIGLPVVNPADPSTQILKAIVNQGITTVVSGSVPQQIMAGTYTVVVKSLGGFGSSAPQTLNVLPTIISFFPTSAATGDTVRVFTNFVGNNVKFGGVAASSAISDLGTRSCIQTLGKP